MQEADFLKRTQAELAALVAGAEVVPAEYRGEVVAAVSGLQAHARRVRRALATQDLEAPPALEAPSARV